MGFFSMADPLFYISNGTTEVDFLDPDSGFSLADPYWNQQMPDLKGGGTFVDPGLTPGRHLVHGVEGTVTETIPLTLSGRDQHEAIRNLTDLVNLLKQADDYQKEPSEHDPVWLTARLAQDGSRTGYSRLIHARIAELPNPFGQPFFTNFNDLARMPGLTLLLEREPFWRAVPPGQYLGPLYNLLKNPDFELWSQGGVEDSQPDNWTDLQTLWITGQNSREETLPHSGHYALKIRVETSSLAGAAKGVAQVVEGIDPNTTYTVVAWVRNEGITNGLGRILITYSSQLELYRSAARSGWSLYAGKFTTGPNDTVAVQCEILSTAAHTAGTLHVDSLMLLPGDFVTEARQGVLPYLSSSHITNHWSQPDALNYVDVWGIPGQADALIRLEVQNNSPASDITDPAEVFSRIRVGQRRTKNVLNLDNLHDPPGLADSDAGGGNRITSPALSETYQTITTKTVEENVPDNLGRYRVLARIFDNRTSGGPNLSLRLRYFLGVAGVAEKTLQAVTALVRGGWTLVDMTRQAAMVQEARKSINPPALLGYAVEMARPAGAETAYLDYVIAIPTDGGWLDATIEPALTQGNTLIVDNTSSLNVAATQRRGGFQTVYRTGQVPRTFAVYQNALYIGCEGGELYRFQNNIGTLVRDYGVSDILAMALYNGRLYVAHGADLYTGQGLSFGGATAFSLGAAVRAMAAFNGLLYFGLADGTIYSYDGSTTSLAYDTGQSAVNCLAVYQGRLYAGSEGSARIYVYDPTSASWSQSASLSGPTEVNALKAHGGQLYAATGAGGQLYALDGESWSLVETFTSPTTILALESLGGLLYAGGSPAGSLQVSADGLSWADAYDPAEYQINALTVYNGALFIAEQSQKDIIAIAFNEVAYKVPNYEGAPFTAPHTRRHRYVFLLDRERNLNDISDKALVGVGFVPRYTTLRGNR